MRWFQTTVAILVTLSSLAIAGPSAAQTFPDYVSTTVNDFADLLPEADERALAERLSQLERDTGVEMTLVTLATQSFFAPGMSLEDFATALFDEWGVGNATTNDGVMVLVFRDDRTMRIELGAAYGRDWDRVAQDVVERHFLNAFSVGDYPRGIASGTEAIIERIVMPFREGADPAPSGMVGSLLVLVGFGTILFLAVTGTRVRDQLVRLKRCPNCGRRGLTPTKETLTLPTDAMPGTGQHVRRCRYCGHEERTAFTISRHQNSSSIGLSGGGGGSFGGGRSGGGGASGRW